MHQLIYKSQAFRGTREDPTMFCLPAWWATFHHCWFPLSLWTQRWAEHKLLTTSHGALNRFQRALWPGLAALLSCHNTQLLPSAGGYHGQKIGSSKFIRCILGLGCGAERQLGKKASTDTLPLFCRVSRSHPATMWGGVGSSVICTCYFGQAHKEYPWQFWIACISHLMAAALVALSSFSQWFSPLQSIPYFLLSALPNINIYLLGPCIQKKKVKGIVKIQSQMWVAEL